MVVTGLTKYRKITFWPQFRLDRSAPRTVSQPHSRCAIQTDQKQREAHRGTWVIYINPGLGFLVLQFLVHFLMLFCSSSTICFQPIELAAWTVPMACSLVNSLVCVVLCILYGIYRSSAALYQLGVVYGQDNRML